MMKLTTQKKIERSSVGLFESAMKTVHYFESKQQDNGSFGAEANDIACYFKAPMMFLMANKPDIAKSILRYIKNNFMTIEGDFKTHENLKSIHPAYIEYWSYMNGWIARAANYLGMVEMSEMANDYLQQYYLGENAGFSTNQITQHPKMSDVLTVAHHGLVNLEMNNMKIATSAGNYLLQAMDKQIDLKHGFYLRLDKNGNLITDFSNDQMPFYFLSSTKPNQLHFMIGYPAAYLAILYKKTKNTAFLTAAKDYLDFSLSCDKSVYTYEFSHKIAWAASFMYERTQDEKYLNVIDKITHYFIAKQQENGMWFTNDIYQSYDQSAEIACWFLDIAKNINFLSKNNARQPNFSI